ncbi:hypothetical protein AWENTII_003631 [Aspergillus wentii]|nr:hypothetical protein MW887_011729 [Aspergillus wentii]
MLQGPEHPSITAVPALDSRDPSSITSSSVEVAEGQQPYDDCQVSHEDPPASSLTQSSDLLSPLSLKQPPSSHRRANTEILPRQTPLPSKQLFVDQSKTFEDLEPHGKLSNPPTENIAKKKLGDGAKLFSGWFQGKSEPVNLGALRQQKDEPARMVSTQEPTGFGSPTSSPMSRAQKRMTPTSPLKQVTSTNRFSFFGLKRQEESKSDVPEPADDDLLNLDITAALFPPGSNDLNDKEAFDALRNNAGDVIRRLQSAYKQRTFALHEAMADKNEKQEELEETRTRVGHLKIQLDGMAEKVLQQEKAMKAMAEELENERQLRQREDEARHRSILLVRPTDDDLSDAGSELQTPKRSLKRASNGTYTSDSGFESGDESLAESVFSRRDGLESPASTIAPSPSMSQIALPTPAATHLQASQKETKSAPAPAPTPTRPSTYDRVLKGLASTSIGSSWRGNSSKCNICYGVPASEAWSVMGVLKEENQGLKGRLGELEMVIDDCLGLVGP